MSEAGREGSRESLPNGYWVSFWGDENVPEPESGVGTTLGMY